MLRNTSFQLLEKKFFGHLVKVEWLDFAPLDVIVVVTHIDIMM